ncbi:MAG: dethiobiotin synthase [Actinomycetota bacterium]|nr:dethiobiotin synthase [Actinomycetota bacterium]
MGRETMVGQGVVITGTDTGVGKTVVAAALAALWRALGDEVTYVKPVQSGTADGDNDAAEVGSLAGVATMTGRRIGPALAPGVAARLVGEELAYPALVTTVQDTAAPRIRLVVEGAGGLLVELGSDGTTLADLTAALGLPLLIVARPGLGTLNHTALTVEAIARRSLDCIGVVVGCYPGRPDLAARTNLPELDRITGGRLLGVVPELKLQGPDPLAGCENWFGPELGGRWDKQQVLGAGRATPADGWHGVT